MRLFKWRNKVVSGISRVWVLDTLSSVVGTVIGIILTFGVTFWIEYQDKKKDNLKVNLMVLENVKDIYYACFLSYQQVIETSPILEEMIILTPEKVATMPQDSLEYFLNSFPTPLFVFDEFARNIINSNFDILRNSDDYDFLFRVSHFFSYYDVLKDFYTRLGPAKLDKEVNDVLMEKGIESGTMDNSDRWNLMEIVKSDRIKYYIRIYLDLFVPHLKSHMENLRNEVNEILNLTDYEEIIKLYENSSSGNIFAP